jgi:hypothetical protein
LDRRKKRNVRGFSSLEWAKVGVWLAKLVGRQEGE